MTVLHDIYRYSYGFSSLNVPPSANLGLSGAVSVYFSFYVSSDGSIVYNSASGSSLSSSQWLDNYLSPSSWSGYFYDINGSVGPDVDSVTVKTFTPSSSPYDYKSPGVIVNLDFDLGEDVLSGFHIDSLIRQYAGAPSQSVYTAFVVPSFRVISTEVAADITALENIADSIVAGNAILGNFYGDVMAVLNNMYSRMGDILAVEQAANTYLSEIVSYLQGIDADTGAILTLLQTYLHYMAEIASTADDILVELNSFHVSFQSRMDLLMSNLALEFSSTRDAIYGAIDILINYLDSTFASAINPDLGQADSDLNAGIDNNHAIEQEWTGSLATDWESLQLNQYNFDSDYTNAFMVVSLWFSNIFNAFGAFGSVLMFPMVVGICMLILGVFRMGFSRTYSGRNQSKGGGSGA